MHLHGNVCWGGGEACSELEWDFFWSDVGWMYEFFDHIHLADHQVIFYFQGSFLCSCICPRLKFS